MLIPIIIAAVGTALFAIVFGFRYGRRFERLHGAPRITVGPHAILELRLSGDVEVNENAIRVLDCGCLVIASLNPSPTHEPANDYPDAA